MSDFEIKPGLIPADAADDIKRRDIELLFGKPIEDCSREELIRAVRGYARALASAGESVRLMAELARMRRGR